MGVVDGQPAHHVGVDGLQLLQRRVGGRVIARGLEGQQIAGEERALEHHGRIPQRVAAVQQHQQDQPGGKQADHPVAEARQFCRGVQERTSFCVVQWKRKIG